MYLRFTILSFIVCFKFYFGYYIFFLNFENVKRFSLNFMLVLKLKQLFCLFPSFYFLFFFVCLCIPFFFFFLILLYNIVLVLLYIDLNPPWVYMCSPSWTPLPPPSPSWNNFEQEILTMPFHCKLFLNWFFIS